jgi:hypothetical protein
MEDKKIKTTDMTRKIRNKFARRMAGKSHAERMAFYREQATKMTLRIPKLIKEVDATWLNNSSDFPTWPGNLETETVANQIREKRASYNKLK